MLQSSDSFFVSQVRFTQYHLSLNFFTFLFQPSIVNFSFIVPFGKQSLSLMLLSYSLQFQSSFHIDISQYCKISFSFYSSLIDSYILSFSSTTREGGVYTCPMVIDFILILARITKSVCCS